MTRKITCVPGGERLLTDVQLSDEAFDALADHETLTDVSTQHGSTVRGPVQLLAVHGHIAKMNWPEFEDNFNAYRRISFLERR